MATAAPPLKLPTKLADLDLKFGKALNTPVREIWPEGEKFAPADCPAAIAHVFIRSSALHARLANAKVAYLFRPSIVKGGKEKGGVASRASTKVAYLTGFDFVIEFSHEVWLKLTPEQRLALVDHQLAHCERDPNTGAWTMRDHDVEEFSDVVHRWGLWTMPLRGFGVAIEKAQIDLFEGTAVGLIEQAAPAIGQAIKAAADDVARKHREKQAAAADDDDDLLDDDDDG